MTSTACPAESASEDTNPVGTLCETAVFIGARSIAPRETRANLAEQCSALRRTVPFAEISVRVSSEMGPRHIKNQS